MGMYTEMNFGFTLKEKTPQLIISTLLYMCDSDNNERPPELPKHALFELDTRWDYMFRCSSYYFSPPKAYCDCYFDKIQSSWNLMVRSSLKNYANEIELFVDWIKPYIENERERLFIGYSRYEEDTEPKLWFIPN